MPVHRRNTPSSKFVGTHFYTWVERGNTMAVFTLGDEQIVWQLTIWCEFMSYCRRLVRLDGQVVSEKSSFQTDKFQTICSSKNLFVPFAHQTNSSSQTICPSRHFVRPLEWKRLMSPARARTRTAHLGWSVAPLTLPADSPNSPNSPNRPEP